MRLDNEPLHPLNGLATIHAGQTVHLSCSAKGGNPTPITTIYINGESYTYDPDLQWSHTLQFVATDVDNGANLSCSAHNAAIDRPIHSQSVKLNVLSK